MIYPICAIRDQKTVFYPPMVEENTQSAIRNFAMNVNAGKGVLGFSPGDFALYHIGNFDSEKGVVEPVVPIDLLVNGNDVFGVNYEK